MLAAVGAASLSAAGAGVARLTNSSIEMMAIGVSSARTTLFSEQLQVLSHYNTRRLLVNEVLLGDPAADGRANAGKI